MVVAFPMRRKCVLSRRNARFMWTKQDGKCECSPVMQNTSLKTFTKSDWAKMELVSAPTSKHGTIKRDASGRNWEWNCANKRVTAKAA
jgi:hypothetical protein